MSWQYKFDDEGRIIRFDPRTGESHPHSPTKEELSSLVRSSTVQGSVFHLVRPFSALLAVDFCQHLALGKTVMRACEASGIKYEEYLMWRRKHEDFREMVEEAKRNRAERVFERLLEVADETGSDRDEVALGKLKAEIFKHVSGVSDEKFVQKTKVSADHRVGVVSIETGIRRPGDPGYRDVVEINLEEPLVSVVSERVEEVGDE